MSSAAHGLYSAICPRWADPIRVLIMSSASPSLSLQEQRAAKDTLECCQDWQHAINEVYEAIDPGAKPNSADSARVTCDGRALTTTQFLGISLHALSQAASDRYDWFDTPPLWEIHAIIAGGFTDLDLVESCRLPVG
jgi:hypothetical protein